MERALPNSALGHTPDAIDLTAARLSKIDWDDFRIFLVAAREGSFTKAALRLGIQQPTVSRRIDALESRIGARLFDRTNRGPVLNHEGERMLQEIEAAEMALGRAARRAHDSAKLVEGECKLAISEGLANAWLVPHFLPVFVKRFPNVVLRIGTANEMGQSLVPPYDIQVQYAPAMDADVSTTRICMFPFNYFASRSYIAAYGEPRRREELVNHRVVDVTASLKSRGSWSTYADTDTVASSSFFTNTGSVAASLITSGSAIGLLPSYALLTNRELVPVIPDTSFKTGLYVNFARDAAQRAPVRAMIDFLKDVVFDRRRMPWFADTFVWPNDEWWTQFEAISQSIREQ